MREQQENNIVFQCSNCKKMAEFVYTNPKGINFPFVCGSIRCKQVLCGNQGIQVDRFLMTTNDARKLINSAKISLSPKTYLFLSDIDKVIKKIRDQVTYILNQQVIADIPSKLIEAYDVFNGKISTVNSNLRQKDLFKIIGQQFIQKNKKDFKRSQYYQIKCSQNCISGCDKCEKNHSFQHLRNAALVAQNNIKEQLKNFIKQINHIFKEDQIIENFLKPSDSQLLDNFLTRNLKIQRNIPKNQIGAYFKPKNYIEKRNEDIINQIMNYVDNIDEQQRLFQDTQKNQNQNQDKQMTQQMEITKMEDTFIKIEEQNSMDIQEN